MGSRDDDRFFFWFMFIFLYLFFSIIFTPTGIISERIQHQALASYEYFGAKETSDILIKTKVKIDNLFVDTGLFKALEDRYIFDESLFYLHSAPDSIQQSRKDDYLTWVERSIHNLVDITIVFFIMLYSAEIFLAFGFVVCIASILDGFLRRQIKKHGFDYSSPFRYGVSLRFLYSLLPLLIIFMTQPFVYVHPYLIPVFVIILAININQAVSNLMKRM